MKKQELFIFIVVNLGICTARLALPDWKCYITTRDTIQYWPFKKDYKVDDVVESVCMEGYKMNGFKLSQCYSYGWDPPLPTCEEDNSESASNGIRDGIQHNSFCPHPPKIRNSEKITIKENYVNGDTVEIKCFPNFKLQGTNIIHCENGIWASPPKCILERDVCRYPPTVAHANTVRKSSLFPRHYRAEYNCHANYVLQGNPTVRCENGAWEDPPVCIEPCFAKVEDLKANNIQLLWKVSSELYLKHDEAIEFKCLLGYEISNSDLLRIKCNKGMLIYPKCIQRDKLLPCGLPPSINYGDVIQTLKTKYDSGSVLEYKCPSFYILEGNQKIKCWNGVWSDPPVCLEPCTATEKDMRENNIQLQWTSAQKIYSLHNDIIEFKCIPQYMISDPKLLRVTCNRGVLNYPKCFKQGTDQDKEREKTDLDDKKLDLLLQDWIPRIVEETCDAPPEVPNGKLKTKQQASYDSGFSVEFECNANFVISGTKYVKCEKGQWSDPPQCTQGCRVSIGDLDKNNVVLYFSDDLKSVHMEGSEVRLRCKPGFRRSFHASLTAECNNGKMRYERCFSKPTCRLNQDMLDMNNMELDPVHGNEIYYEEGENVKFRCKEGFSSKEITGRCSNRVLSYPICEELRSE
ncbi:Hypothetical predicted protein [Pelobates cultripes]|uniref:Sushi domain-containing protein n=1 Tax=Pelobates cultripes TaxID=61616 RepID=A0AAD1WLQ2_PELCU|nr:Hypothetical predicted protein [Pelobates cultripes]